MLAAIVVMIVVAIEVATLAGLVQFAAALFRLPAPFAVFANGLLQVELCPLDATAAFVVPIPGLAWHSAA
jgi:hypothetical protein